jgi:trans-aconitate 2-methyltransferase
VTGDTWDPAQYERFADERSQPFYDLLGLCRPVPGGRVVDLGCGTGALTADLHRAMQASSTLGIDNSSEMLAGAATDVPGLAFAEGDLGAWRGPPVDVVFANASLHWVSDHPSLLGRLTGGLEPGGQLAFQLPANFAHPSHVVARALAAEQPFLDAFGGEPPPDRGASVLAPAAYAELLHRLGAVEQHVRLQIYGHELAGPDDVVQWVLGSMLRPYQSRLDPPTFDLFMASYRERLLAELGTGHPYYLLFPRILCWARFPGTGG